MREIKFRAWVEGRGMDYCEAHRSLGVFIDFHEINYGLNGFMLMQYTGLRDKNGVEIYEGDVVSGGMLLCSGGYSIRNDKTTVNYSSGMFKAGTISLCSIARDTEVLGNVYENPELLEAVK